MTDSSGGAMPMVALQAGEEVPALGQGTWHMGEAAGKAAEEAAALTLGIGLGMTLIDTAEMYGEGGAEKIVAQATGTERDRLFIVSKVYPHNATSAGVRAACERSLQRLRTDRIDLYLLHWPGSVPIAETIEAFARLRESGKIRHHGVSNFDQDEMAAWVDAAGSEPVAANQILYNLTRRGPEFDLIPWCRQRGIAIMAYSPIEQGRLLKQRALSSVATRRGATPAQIALAWLLRQDGIIAIPKAVRAAHVRENRGALDVTLSPEDLAELDQAFPPPGRASGLQML